MPTLASPVRARPPSHFEFSLDRLNDGVLAMGRSVDLAVEGAVRAFVSRDVAQAQAVVAGDASIDVLEMRLDEECLKLTALYRPTGLDLRILTGTMKIISDLERVGDLAVTIAEQVLAVAEMPAGETPPAVLDMAERVRSMLASSLDALVKHDTAKANEVLRMDDPIDALLRGIYTTLEGDMAKNPDRIPSDLQILSAAKNVERIADHASNVAEDVVYMVEGSILRHRH